VPLDRKRRIFRPSSLAPARRRLDLHPTLLLGATGALLVGAVILMSDPASLFGRVPAPAGTLSAGPRQVAVVDGSTLRLGETVLRLRGVLAPTRGRLCHDGEGRSYDCGAAAAEALAALVRDRPVACHLAGRDASGVVEAACEAEGTDLNRALIAAGWARASGESPSLRAAEGDARAARRGLWASEAR
jgi:endonuclease YncB( thermonuclease family)